MEQEADLMEAQAGDTPQGEAPAEQDLSTRVDQLQGQAEQTSSSPRVVILTENAESKAAKAKATPKTTFLQRNRAWKDRRKQASAHGQSVPPWQLQSQAERPMQNRFQKGKGRGRGPPAWGRRVHF